MGAFVQMSVTQCEILGRSGCLVIEMFCIFKDTVQVCEHCGSFSNLSA